jgi:DNA-binding MarR family transcriptional regulator
VSSDDPDAPAELRLPETLSSRTAYLLARAAARAHSMAERVLAPLEISPREYSVLAVLAEHSPLTQTRIAEILGLDRTTILKLGASLERRGLVIRERDEHDRRAYAIALTPAGDRLREHALAQMVACEAQFLMPLAGDQRDQLHDLLSRVVEM